MFQKIAIGKNGMVKVLILSLNDAGVLFNQVGNEFDTEIGKLFITRIDPINQTFAFQGTGKPLF